MSRATRHNAHGKGHSSSSPSTHASSRQPRLQPTLCSQQPNLSTEPRALLDRPSISACMIVKNEAANLRPCLESLGDLASEIVVVDTGSTDNTVQIAQEMGARVVDFPWIDDFAAARNESLRHATKDWIFWLDADDRLDPKAVAQLKSAAASGRADAFMCQVCSNEPGGKRTITEHIRLFRNRLNIRFAGAIHEGVYGNIVSLGLRLVLTDISVEHLGYESPESNQAKAARNLAIIEQELALHPERIDLKLYRGQALGTTGNTEGAKSDLRDYLASTSPNCGFDHLRFWAYSVLSPLQYETGERDTAEATVSRALAEFPGHPRFLHLLGGWHLASGKTEEAIDELVAALSGLQREVKGLRPNESAIQALLARGCRTAGRREDALVWAERAAAGAPDDGYIGTLLARLYLETGRMTEAEATASIHAKKVGFAGPWMILAEARHNLGKWAEADEALVEAQSRGAPEARVQRMRSRMKAVRILAGTRTESGSSAEQLQARMEGLALLAGEDYAGAAELFTRAIEAEPSQPDNYKYLAVALQKLGQEAQALEAWSLAARCASSQETSASLAQS